ncbi:unnamed protein product [Penicillium pancosmium]
MSYIPLQPKHEPSDDETTDDEGDYEDGPQFDSTSTDTAVLATGDEVLREKFLNSISELLAHRKGGKYVTAAALREKEDSIEVDIARNTEFEPKDSDYLSSLARFLHRQGEPRSSLNLRVRGCHGKCHPLWGIPLLNSNTMKPRIQLLCEAIKERLRQLMEPSQFPKTVAVQQSSAVSELKSMDMLVIGQQRAYREEADKRGQEYRENMQLLSVGPPEIFCHDLKSLCVICQMPRPMDASGWCQQCLSTWYCSERCRRLDQPAHDILCSQYFSFRKTCPSDKHKIGIWFPRDTKEPKLVWVTITSKMGEYYADFDAFLGPNHAVLFTIPLIENKRRGLLTLDHQITIYYQDWDDRPPKTNQSVQHAVEACNGMRVPQNLYGDYVAVGGRRGDPPFQYFDIDCADFRHILDYFSTCFDETICETLSGGSVRAVKISCPLEQKLKLNCCEQFQSVAVDRDFSSTRMISGLSMALGDPIWICEINNDELKDGITQLDELPENPWQNTHAQILSIDIDAKSDSWGMSSSPPWHFDGSIIVMRGNGMDLDVEWVQHICAYYLKVLQPLFARSLSGELSREDVLAEVTREKIMTWISVVMLGELMSLGPQRGVVERF